MNFKDFQADSMRTMPKINDELAMANYCMGLAGESGEVVDQLKKVIFHGHNFDREAIEKELGDVLHYLSGIATLLDISMEEIAYKNLEKLKKRYPEGFSKEASRNRVE
ncbi:nucleotide pyrophosphohydrolase [Bacillus sp. J14TS2]|uniref:nucleoside triphosphate pyrophosphohydrolase family protein n=1 Tax=Bacillus sp. J14TS2 TaxID=2807188 RepID=UPI001B1CF7C4|nr:nucleoside triphosphate pyrophosphohydrolase family protein [Bacillus sp. J14TS2]GIN74010.1 nucleotide pyrophosphohydrolase [Bacillus sp. J14TS2]